MTWLVGLLTLIKALPDLIAVLRELMKFIHEAQDYIERWEKTKKMHQAIKKARETGDTSGLDELFGGRKNVEVPNPNQPSA